MTVGSNVCSSFVRGKAISERERSCEKLNLFLANNGKTGFMLMSRLTKGLHVAQESVDKKFTLRRQESRNRRVINKKADLFRAAPVGQPEGLSAMVL